jgi:hypothetical protein
MVAIETDQVSFETTRINGQCLVDTYNRLVPITRRLQPARKPDLNGAVAPRIRGGDHA